MRNAISSFIILMAIVSCTAQVEQNHPLVQAADTATVDFTPVDRTESEWREVLSEEAFYVLRKKGTERAFSGQFWDNKKDGIYSCAGCGLPLFDSSTKFKSGTGWPSYYKPVKPGYIDYVQDNTHGMSRTEVVCARCQGHLGHVFSDGPQPTGLRYCINSVSLDFEEGKEIDDIDVTRLD